MRYHPILHTMRRHEGYDLGKSVGLGRGARIYAVSDGVVRIAGWNGGYGNFVSIGHSGGIVSQYGHMLSNPLVRAGQKVKKGQLIGYMGSTGLSTGDHLHFEIRKDGTVLFPDTFITSGGRSIIPVFAKGGYVQATRGGMLGLIGEGGRTERIEPLDNRGLSDRDRDIINRLDALAESSISVRVFIGEKELTDLVRTEIKGETRSMSNTLRGGVKVRP
jgi:hypothetical protein